MAKLVRDNIPDIIRSKGEDPKVHQAPESLRVKLLLDKLEEEVGELRAAKGTDEAYEEMADVLEVVAALSATFEAERLSQVRALKHHERGGFERLYVLSP